MADFHTYFSEVIGDITEEERAWAEKVLKYDVEGHDEESGACRACALLDLLEAPPSAGFEDDDWPGFCWKLDADELWLYSEDNYEEGHLALFVQAFIRKFRPDYTFSVTSALVCSKPRMGEFGGGWMVITKDEIRAGNTWDAADDAVLSESADAR